MQYLFDVARSAGVKRTTAISQCLLIFSTFGCDGDPDATQIARGAAAEFFRDRKVISLVEAAEAGDIQKMKAAIKSGANVNAVGASGITPLRYVFEKKKMVGFAELLAGGADPNARDSNGISVISESAGEADPEWLRRSLDHGGDPNLRNKGNRFFPGCTPLFSAVLKARAANVKLLIEKGANVNHVSDKIGRPIELAVNQSYEIVFMLLQADAIYRVPGGFDLVWEMKILEKNKFGGMSEQGILWFRRTKEWLELRGENFK